ncbi:hypothetical protein [Mixta gaviniae]|uniref:Uncharacterized protein n=1 Tax=Mixta gaviniae TaxID=665914 RepID=A0A2L0ID67_9GAMM|nr:hypothetical protein [Mixta gaviniae]AUX92551.1 hypothetical protein C2E15_05315 [Mixta gaviniae]
MDLCIASQFFTIGKTARKAALQALKKAAGQGKHSTEKGEKAGETGWRVSFAAAAERKMLFTNPAGMAER